MITLCVDHVLKPTQITAVRDSNKILVSSTSWKQPNPIVMIEKKRFCSQHFSHQYSHCRLCDVLSLTL